MRTVILMLGAMVLGGCGGADGRSTSSSTAPLIESDGAVPTPPGPNPEQCAAGQHACSLGVTGYDCTDTRWYYCAAADAGCWTPPPCVPEPVDGGPDAIAAWLAGR